MAALGSLKEQIVTMVSKAQDFQELTTVLYSDVDMPGMLRKVPTWQFGSSTLLKLLLSITAKPTQAALAGETALSHEPSMDSTDSMAGGDSDDEDGFTTVKVSNRSKQKASLGSQKKSASTLEPLLGAHASQLLPDQLKAEHEVERKRQQDLANTRPGPLFLMVWPGEMVGTFLFVVRLKYQALARTVLNGLVPFLTHHLLDGSFSQTDETLSKWVSKRSIRRARRRDLVWCPNELRAKPGSVIQVATDDGLDFLEGFGEDPTAVFNGTLEFDLEMADAKDIDAGATVAGVMDELRETEAQLADAHAELDAKDAALDEKDAALGAKDAIVDEQATEIARLQALLDRSAGLTGILVPPPARSSTQPPEPPSPSIRGAKLPRVRITKPSPCQPSPPAASHRRGTATTGQFSSLDTLPPDSRSSGDLYPSFEATTRRPSQKDNSNRGPRSPSAGAT